MLGYGIGLTWTALVSPTVVTTTKVGWFKDEFLINFSPEALALGDVNAKIGSDGPPSNLNVTYPTMSISGFYQPRARETSSPSGPTVRTARSRTTRVGSRGKHTAEIRV